MYALLELHTCLSILWLLNTYLIAILASMGLYMNVAWFLRNSLSNFYASYISVF